MSGLKEMPVGGGVSEHLQREEGDIRAEKKGGSGLPPELLSEYATPSQGVLCFIFWV
ncbi:TPA: hypothetical protein ACJ29H_004389 [Salmonella enterica subsp. enterica serovar Wandsworth]